MTTMRTKIIVGGIVVISALSYLAVAGVKKGWVYFMPVDQFVDQSEFHGRRVRLNGKVGTDNLDVSRAGMYARFNLAGEKSTLRVEYRGVIPEMFKETHEVVIEGQLGSDNVFHADTLMTKCASKYEAGQQPADMPTGHKPVATTGSEKS